MPYPHRPPVPEDDDPNVRAIAATYVNLRAECDAFENLLGNGGGLTEKDAKRLDKAASVMKVGFKLMKKALKQHAKARKVTA